MNNRVFTLATREQMIQTIKTWYTFQMENGEIEFEYYRVFIRLVDGYNIQTLMTFYWISKEGLERNGKSEESNKKKL